MMQIVITCCFIAFDLLTGILQAWKNKELKSSKMREGLFHKVGFLCVIVLGLGIDKAQIYFDLGFSAPIGTAVNLFICGTEIVSIYENICKISPDLANSKLSQYFNIVKKED